MKTAKQFGLAILTLLLFSGVASACPVCFGETDSKMADGINMGVLFLLGITGLVLSGFITLIFTIWIRIHRFEKQGDAPKNLALTYTVREN